MLLQDVIGQHKVKEILLSMLREQRVPHAIMLCGAEGTGKMPLALAFATLLCCENPQHDDACGQCPSCVKMRKLVHPDVHFAFPVIRKKPGRPVVSDDWIEPWRQMLTESPYFSLPQWMQRIEAGNAQPGIFVDESDEIYRKLSLKASQGDRKIMIIWQPEKMNAECANKLLKLLEEPPKGTVFLMVTEEPDMVLPTLVSRMQRINIPLLEESDLSQMLEKRYMLPPTDAADIAHRSEGSVLKALETIHTHEENNIFFDLFVSLMRLAYARQIKEMKAWSEQLAGMGREKQKRFLSYCQHMLRENFIYNFRQKDMNYLSVSEQQFAVRFAPFINERSVIGILTEIELSQRHIEQNANAKFVFFDFSLKMIVLLKQP